MLKTIADSYKLFFRKFPIIVLYALPLLVLSAIEVFFENQNTENKGVHYFLVMSAYLIPLVSAAVDVALYKRFLGIKNINPLQPFKTYFSYFFVQLGIGLIAVAPLHAVFYILNLNSGPTLGHLVFALVVNMFLGIYVLARLNLILPLIIQNKLLNLKDFMAFSRDSYLNWIIAGFLIYSPFLVSNYVIANPYVNTVITNLCMLLFICFNTTYVLSHMTKTPVQKEPVAKAAPQAEAKKTEVKKAPVKKAAAKKAAPKAETQKEPKKPAVKKKTTKKAATPKLKPVTA